MVSFNTIPGALRVPLVAAEFDNTRANQGAGDLPYRALLIGQKISAGTGTADTLQRVTNADQVATKAGRGSQLHLMAKAWFAANKSTELWIGLLADDGSAVKASATLTLTGPATADGVLSLYIGGQLVRVPVASGDTANSVAAAIAAAVGASGASGDLPAYATVATNVVTLHAVNGGLCGNEIDVRLNYQDGEETPPGLAVAIVAFASGAANPLLTNLIAAMGDTWFQVIAHPYTDATSLTALETELHSRFGALRMIDGVAFTAKNASYSTVATLGQSRNSPHSVIIRTGGSPTTAPEVAANVAAQVALSAQIDPALPFQTLELVAVKAPAEADRDTIQERNTLLFDGVATIRPGAGDVMQIERLITTYRVNSAGLADTSYLDVTTMLSLLFARWSFANRIATRYPRHKLANDGTKFASGQAIITPKIGKAEAFAWFRDLEERGLFEDFETFKANLVVERNASDPNRLDFLLPPNLVNQLIKTAAQIQFSL